MYCPICNHILRLTPEEKTKSKMDGVVEHICYNCKRVVEITSGKKNATIEHRKLMGVCVYCGVAQADEGYVSCQICRDQKAKKREETKSLATELAEEAKKAERKKKMGELDSISKMAYDNGVSYGVMTAILEGRMKMPKKD